MPKKPSKKSAKKPQPQVAQLKAVERLLEAGDYQQAISKLRPLVKRFPDHGGLRSLLVEALDHDNDPRAAAVAAFEWAQRKPNSLVAQEALLHYAVLLNHVLVADRVAEKVRELGGETPGFPLEPEMQAAILELPDGSRADVEEMERFDIGKIHLDSHDFAGAIRWLEGIDVLPARNNYALALFHLGRIGESLAAHVAGWQRDSENLFALGWAVRLRLYQGDDAGARGLCTPLANAVARRLDDALPQIDALLLLQQDQAAWDAFERAINAGWADLDHGLPGAVLRHYGACAAMRLGRPADADRLWREALQLGSESLPAAENLKNANNDSHPSSFPAVLEPHQTLPLAWLHELRAEAKEPGRLLGALDASNSYLEALYINGNGSLRSLVGFILKYRAERADADAAQRLREFARLPIGTRKERFRFLNFLREQGLLKGNDPVAIWDGEGLREVRVTGTEIYREPEETDLPRDLEELLGEAILLFSEGQADEAERKLNTILKRVPDHPVVLGNLSAVLSKQGRHEEALALLREVVDKNPDYLFARCNLASSLIMEGDYEQAETLLDGLIERERLHIQDAFALHGTLAMLYEAKGQSDSAQALVAGLESMVENEDDERNLQRVKRKIAFASPMSRFTDTLKTVLQEDPAYSGQKK